MSYTSVLRALAAAAQAAVQRGQDPAGIYAQIERIAACEPDTQAIDAWPAASTADVADHLARRAGA